MIDNILHFFSLMIVWVCAVAFLAMGIGYIIDSARRFYQDMVRQERDSAIKQIGMGIKSGSHWFEKREYIVLEEAGKYINENGCFDPKSVRETIRERFKKEDL